MTIQKNFVLKFIVFFIAVTLSFELFLFKNSVAVILDINHFFNGQPTVVKDIIESTGMYFGGYDSNGMPLITEIGSTDLTITTEGTPLNVFKAAFGGGLTQLGQYNTINGDVKLTIQNTELQTLGGGSHIGFTGGGHILIKGSVNMFATNCTVKRLLIGGSSTSFANVINTGQIAGSINMFLTNVFTPTLLGVGDVPGIEANHIAVAKDVNITATDSNLTDIYLTSNIKNVNVGGNVTFTANNSTITNLFGSGSSDIFGNLTMNIGPGSKVTSLFATQDGTVYGTTSITLKKAMVNNLVLGSSSTGTLLKPVTLIVTDSTVNTVSCGHFFNPSPLPECNVIVNSGAIKTISLGGGINNIVKTTATINDGLVNTLFVGSTGAGCIGTATAIIRGGTVEDLTLGSNLTGQTINAIADINGGTIGRLMIGAETPGTGITNLAVTNIAGGWINNIVTGHAGNSVINFTPGKKSYVKTSITGPNLVEEVNIQKNARTEWGMPKNDFTLETKDFVFSGTLMLPHNTTTLYIEETFVADGGTIIPKALTPETKTASIHITGSPQANLIIKNPLHANFSASPELIGHSMIPLIQVTPTFASHDLFVKKSRSGLVWADFEFQPASNTWFVNNIRASEDFYAFSTAREASSWLRQQHVLGIQARSNTLLENGNDGLWIDVQGGYEKFDTSIGNDAKMPWLMASMGYDYLQELSSAKMKALYGFGVGATRGRDKWQSSYNTTKNTIEIGMASAYFGLIHSTGLYSTLTAQIATSRIHTKCSGFYKEFKWTETTPTEAVELGWQYAYDNGFRINPRGKVIFEQTSKHRFSLPYKNDNATLNKSHLTTTVLGLAGAYHLQSAPIDFQASFDWIRGLFGDFAIQSRILDMKFKHSHNANAFRASLKVNTQLIEHFDIHCNVFGEVGDDKGVGGQIGATYTF